MKKDQVKTAGAFSKYEIADGGTKDKNQIQRIKGYLNKFLLKVATFAITTFIGDIAVLIWQMRSELSEVKGRVFSPDKYLETLDSRLNKLEKENNELKTHNYQLEIIKMKLEMELKNKK